ncbi:MAG: hypothetical protein EA422_11320 [Gemmatimonadales bacterium]|nr:MAG: hypothetical protein EA422_11320 [Gemmatimonadales bacterium]
MQVRDFFLVLAKTLRAYQLYDESNPVRRRFMSSLKDAARRIWEHRDQMQVVVREDRFVWMGEEVYRDENRAGSLCFLIYRDGVRELTFRAGVEEELEPFLQALRRLRVSRSAEDDLVTLLWDLELGFLEYAAVDLVPEGTLLRADGVDSSDLPHMGGILSQELDAGLEGEAMSGEGDGAPPPDRSPASINPDDFNPTLYALDERERVYVEGLYRAELEQDLGGSVLNALMDRLDGPNTAPDRQLEIVAALGQLLPTFLAQGALRQAALLLAEVERTLGRGRRLSPEAGAQIVRLLDVFSSEESVRELIQALEEGAVDDDEASLSLLLRHLKPEALGPLLARIEKIAKPEVRRRLRRAVRALAEGEGKRVQALLTAPDPYVVRGAIRLVGAIRDRSAVPALIRLLEGEDSDVRMTVLEAARRVPSTAMLEAVEQLLVDPDREFRMAAARVLAEVGFIPSIRTLAELLSGSRIREADLTEKLALFEAYADLAGDDGVPLLGRILNHRGFLGRRDPPESRACAALVLGRIGGAQAVTALERAQDDEEAVVRTAVRRALEGGGSND